MKKACFVRFGGKGGYCLSPKAHMKTIFLTAYLHYDENKAYLHIKIADKIHVFKEFSHFLRLCYGVKSTAESRGR